MPFKIGVLAEALSNLGGFDTGFCLFRGGSGATIVKPDFGELALTNPGGLINPVLTLPSVCVGVA